MTEPKRTADEIRAYCEAVERELTKPFETVKLRANVFVELGLYARTDLPRVLEAAEHRGLALRRILTYCDDVEIVKAWATNALDDTAFLADSPEPALSPDGENGEGSET